MSKEIKTEITIQASPKIIWEILTNFENYPQWNPFIKSITGDAIVGQKIKARIEPPGASGMTFKPRVLSFTSQQKFSWLGHLLIPGLFDGEHSFEIINNEDGTCKFLHSEKFSGLLVPLFSKMLDVNTVQGFNLMNIKIKELAEKK